MSNTKWKVGTRVKVTKEGCALYRDILLESHRRPGASKEFPFDSDPKSLKEMLLWAMADKYVPEGFVVEGHPAEPATTVKVRLTSVFGEYEHYFDKDYLLKKGRK